MFVNVQGLLVEADPKNYALLMQKQRKAWASNSCLATKPYPHKVCVGTGWDFRFFFNLKLFSRSFFNKISILAELRTTLPNWFQSGKRKWRKLWCNVSQSTRSFLPSQ